MLVAIGQSADAEGFARPGMTEIAERTGIARGKIPELVKVIEAAGLMTVERRGRRVSFYRINYGPAVSPPTGVPAPGDCPRAESGGVPEQGCEVSPHTGTKQTKSRPEEQKKDGELPLGEYVAPDQILVEQVVIEGAPVEQVALKQVDVIEQAFEEIWSEYPRKVAKKAALKAYRSALKHRGVSKATILLGVRIFAAGVRQKGTEEQYVPYLATWLRHERWSDAPELNGSVKDINEISVPASGARPKDDAFAAFLDIQKRRGVFG